MIKYLLFFAVLCVAIHLAITGWRSLTGKERWALTKSIGYSIIVGLLAVVVMVSIVITF